MEGDEERDYLLSRNNDVGGIMEPMETALILSTLTDVLFRLGAESSGLTPEEFKDKVDALQVKADDLEDWLKGE